MRKRQTISLFVFLKGSADPKQRMPGCGNYDHHCGGCLLWGDCHVEQGKCCRYFEAVTLPTAAELGMTEKIYSLYEKHCKVSEPLKRPQSRICPDCGTGLKARQRFCEKCSRRRRQATYRRSRQKKAG